MGFTDKIKQIYTPKENTTLKDRLGKNITNNINLLAPTAINKTRSYKIDDRKAVLNFALVDKTGEQIFSINGQFDKKYLDTYTIINGFNDFNDDGSYDFDIIAAEIFNFACRKKWYPDKTDHEVAEIISSDTADDLLSYYFTLLPIVAKEFIDRLDFNTLQTKEEFEKKEATIKESARNLKDKLHEMKSRTDDKKAQNTVIFYLKHILDGEIVVPKEWDVEGAEYKKNEVDYVSWIHEENLIMVMKFDQEEDSE